MVGKHWEFAGACVRRAALLAAAGLLLIAGSLKLADVLASRPLSGVLAQFPVALVPALAIGELAIAISICLWGGASQRAIGVLYLLLGAVAAWEVALGSASCGCFGALHVPPQWTLLVDLGLAFALLLLPRQRLEGGCGVSAKEPGWFFSFRMRLIGPLAAAAMITMLSIDGTLARGAMRAAAALDNGSTRLLIPEDWLGQTIVTPQGHAGSSLARKTSVNDRLMAYKYLRKR